MEKMVNREEFLSKLSKNKDSCIAKLKKAPDGAFFSLFNYPVFNLNFPEHYVRHPLVK
jgi:hypothetical protein